MRGPLPDIPQGLNCEFLICTRDHQDHARSRVFPRISRLPFRLAHHCNHFSRLDLASDNKMRRYAVS